MMMGGNDTIKTKVVTNMINSTGIFTFFMKRILSLLVLMLALNIIMFMFVLSVSLHSFRDKEPSCVQARGCGIKEVKGTF